MELERMPYREMVARLGGGSGPWYCPAHDDRAGKSKSLGAIESPDGSGLPTCFSRGCSRCEIFAALRGLPVNLVSRQHVPTIHPGDRDEADRIEFARGIWHDAKPARGTLVEAYLHHRGINIIPSTIRFSNLKHPSGVALPAMVCAMMDLGGNITAVHRTFIGSDGRKADIEPVKMGLGPCAGNAVHLAPAGPTLAIAEGIETGLSVLQATGLPTWACLGTSGLKGLKLPDVVTEVVIAADNDAPGIKAAHEAAMRFIQMGRAARIAKPPTGVGDFNDVLRGMVAGEQDLRHRGCD